MRVDAIHPKHLLAALLVIIPAGLFIALGRPAEPQPDAKPIHIGAATAAADDPAVLDQPAPLNSVSTPRRDLFRFFDPPPRRAADRAAPVAASEAPIVQEPVTTQTAANSLQVPDPPPAFGYRYIGKFGPRGNEIAVFKGSDDLLNRRPGERVDARFTLKSIGLESVDVAGPDGAIQRVEISRR